MAQTAAKLTSSGQISLPAHLRRRWGATAVLVIDRGDYAIVRPLPADPIKELRGAYAGDGPSTKRARAVERAAEIPRQHRDQNR